MKPPLIVAIAGVILISLLSSWPISTPTLTAGGGIIVQSSNHVTITVNDRVKIEQDGAKPQEKELVAPVEGRDPNDTSPPLTESLVDHILPILQDHEGYSEEPYSLHGLPHVCWGHQLEQPESKTEEECQELLAEDTALAINVATDYGGPIWEQLSVPQQGVLTELAYTLGYAGLFSFKELRKAVWAQDWARARAEIQDSLLPDKDQLGQDRVDSMKGRLDG